MKKVKLKALSGRRNLTLHLNKACFGIAVHQLILVQINLISDEPIRPDDVPSENLLYVRWPKVSCIIPQIFF